MKKTFLLALSMVLMLLLSGCSTVASRSAKVVQRVNEEEKDITVQVLGTATLAGGTFGAGEGDAGLVLSIKNETTEVKYINWSSSSLTYDGVTSRIIIGSDKVVNINSVVPNTALLPGREVSTTIYAADVIQYHQGTTGFDARSYYYTNQPIKNKVDLIISYSGKNINELKQAIYSIELEPAKERFSSASSTAENQKP